MEPFSDDTHLHRYLGNQAHLILMCRFTPFVSVKQASLTENTQAQTVDQLVAAAPLDSLTCMHSDLSGSKSAGRCNIAEATLTHKGNHTTMLTHRSGRFVFNLEGAG